MKGLIIKDLKNLKKYSHTVLIMIAFYILFMTMMESIEFLSGIVVLMCAVSVITSFAYDKQSGWDAYALTLPLPRKDFVFAKYALALLLTAFGTTVALLTGWLYGLFKGVSNFTETLLSSYAMFVVAILFLCVLLPLVYRFGVERSRVLIFALVAIPTSSLIVLSQTGVITMPEKTLLSQLFIFSPLLLIACAAVSIALSYRIFKRKQA